VGLAYPSAPFYEEGKDMTKTLLEMKSITKVFPGVKALDNVNITVQEGEIHGIVGENGAGKSTLHKLHILCLLNSLQFV